MRRARGLLLLVALTGCGAHTAPGTAHRAHGVRFVLPAGWHVASRSLTPHLANPREVFTAGTGPLPVAPSRCAQVPAAALAAMRADDVLVSVEERFGADSGFAPRPRQFQPGPSNTDVLRPCAGPGSTISTYWSGFRDGGRGFHVLIALGRAAPPMRMREALAILDSMRIAPRMPVRINPDAALPEHDAPAGIDFVHPITWRYYRQPLTQAIAAGDQLALGTFRLHQRRPDTNCAPATALRSRPPRGGFLFVYESTLNPTELARVPQRPRRLTLSGPRPYECFGSSWRVDFRDHGRAFTAHVYGPPRRRRQALAILDSLRIRPAPFVARLRAARFRGTAPWRVRVSGPQHASPCLRQRTSWASTVPFTDRANALPPHRMIASLPPDGIIMAVVQWRECRMVRGLRTLRPPLSLSRAVRMQFPGPRGDELPLFRVMGRFPGRYNVDVWLFYGRRHPTAAQRAAARRELSAVRWPTALGR
jgi:hypothetical protein